MNAEKLIDFMTRLFADSKMKVFLILDNLRDHHSKAVAAWLEDHKHQIELFYWLLMRRSTIRMSCSTAISSETPVPSSLCVPRLNWRQRSWAGCLFSRPCRITLPLSSMHPSPVMLHAFQGERYVPFVVLSVKAGGTGLNLTRANHVIHFDRWWNPAVENQATDRVYRIGQTKNVMVHKLMCEGTIEEKIDAMLESKRELATNVIGSGSEKWITEMSNDELMSLLRLD